MVNSILNKKRILVVDDEPDILSVVEQEILEACPDCKIEKATNYEDASRLLKAEDYNLVILDIMGVRGFDLLDLAVARKLSVAMLTAHALNLEAMETAYKKGAKAYLPKDKPGELIPLLEDVLQYDYQTSWKRLFDKLGDYFNDKFEKDWKSRALWQRME